MSKDRQRENPAPPGETAVRKARFGTNISASGYAAIVAGTAVLLVLVFMVALSVGRYHVPIADCFRILASHLFPVTPTWDDMSYAVVMTLRVPRSLAAVLVGGALALSGACYQSIFKNPMVSPDLLGVSSGACVGAATAILLGGGSLLIQAGAFFMGLLTVFATTMIARLVRNDSTTVLVLSGVVVGNLMSSIMNIIKSLADPDTELAEITYWTMGSFASIDRLSELLPVLPTILIPVVLILLARYRLNVLSLGDSEARSLGVDLRKTRGLFVVCSTLISASCVCLAGTIGWVGLVIPHIARMLVGADNKRMLPVAMLSGSVFMLVIDILCRTLSAAELHIGVLTGLVGAPFFIFLLVKQNRSLS